MASTTSWVWQGSGTFPGFKASNQNNLGNSGNGVAINPGNYRDITFNDANNDGVISDNDTGDGSSANGDTITMNGASKVVAEVAMYNNSTMVHDGVTYTVPMTVWAFTDGTYAVRIADSSIPPGSYTDVTALKLGTFNATEYSGTFIATRDDAFVCFAQGTLIDTETGLRAVETLSPGARVRTADHGLQTLRWSGAKRVAARGAMAPVRFEAGAVGNTRPLLVSPQHRMLATGWQVQLHTGQDEALIAARHLINHRDIRHQPCADVTYIHLMFDRHEVIFAEGAACESFHPGAMGLGLLDQPTRAELLALFPDLAHHAAGYGPTVRTYLRAHDAQAVAA